MIELLIKTFWLLLPAGIANMAPVLFKWVPLLDYPIDLNLKFREKPLFGKNKTYRGFLFGTLIAIVIVYLQQLFYLQTKSITLIDYSKINIFLLGFSLGFGALFGDLIKSFFKRQIGIDSGKHWIPFDQIDWIIGAFIFMIFYIPISLKYFWVAIIFFGLLHPIINLIGYYLGIKKNKF